MMQKEEVHPTWFYILASHTTEEEEMNRIKEYARNADGNVRVLGLLDPAVDAPKRCIYVTHCSSGISQMDLSPVLEIKGVSSWLIVICGMTNKRSAAGFPALRDTWEQKTDFLEASIKVIPDDENCRDAIWEWMQSEIMIGDHERICLLASSRRQSGRSLLRKCLEKIPESIGWQFEERLIQDDDYASIRDAAARVVFIGSELNDFTLPYYDGGLRKSVFFLNKCDVQPLCFRDAAGARQSILELLRDYGWDLSVGQTERIFIGSVLYGGFYLDLQYQSLLLQDLLARDDFAMWDEYLLPAARETYSSGHVMAFLKQCDCIGNMAEYLFSRKSVHIQ